MKHILVVGSGAREHALVRALSHSKHKPQIFCCGTSHNPGIEEFTAEYWVGDINDVNEIIRRAKQWNINLAIIGPEAPLERGLADALWDNDIKVIGPKKKLAQIETSKSYARELMQKYSIPGLPKYKIFTELNGVKEFLEELGEEHYVVKANGLMGGKGVKVSGDHLHSFDEAIAYCNEIFSSKQSLVIEEKLIGQEFSFMCFSDGKSLAPMPLVQDNKRAYEDDKGPNTGGMGTFSSPDHSLPFLQPRDLDQALHINQLVINALMKETNEPYIGILYGGFIATAKGVYVIEFNARFGDPEALNVLSLLESDLVDLCISLTEGRLEPEQAIFANKATVCKYAVPKGYPDEPVQNVLIDIHDVKNKAHLYLGAVNSVDGALYATGSRTAAYVGVADSLAEAECIAEKEISTIKGPLFHRKDIGTTDLINKRIEAMRKLREL